MPCHLWFVDAGSCELINFHPDTREEKTATDTTIRMPPRPWKASGWFSWQIFSKQEIQVGGSRWPSLYMHMEFSHPHVCVYVHVVYVLHIHMYIRLYIGIKENRIQNHIGWRLTPGMFHSSHCWNHVHSGITIIFPLVENPTYQGTEVWKLCPLNTAKFTTLKVKMHIMAASFQH